MLRTFSGTRYDTSTALEIGEAQHGEYITDYSYWRATLYKTPRSGRYFLAGEGGPMTQFAASDDGGLVWGGRIILMTLGDAQEWAELHLPAHRVEREFGPGEAWGPRLTP